MAKLKLGAITEDKPVKLTVELSVDVHRDLLAYAEVLAHEIASERTRQKREEMAGQISAIPDEQIRDRLSQAMTTLFLAIEADLERKCRA